MTLTIPDGYAQHSIIWMEVAGSHTASCSTGIEIGSSDLGDTLSAMNDAWTTHMGGGALSEGWQFLSGKLITQTEGLELPIGTDGTGPIDCCPPNCCALIKKGSTTRGRANRGRWYLPAGYLPESMVDNVGGIDEALVADLQDNATALLTAMQGAVPSGNVVLLHSDGAIAPTPILGVGAEGVIATQRRRLR